MAKNIIICLDGTANEPERNTTNVARVFDLALRKAGQQITYYDPGVGTMGARSATSRLGKALTRVGGLAFGHGVDGNIAEAYQFLMENYEPDDRIFIFGFSRGAYTARALAGLLRTVGLLERGAVNLVPYAMKLYTGAPRPGAPEEKGEKFWNNVQHWSSTFGNPEFKRFPAPVHFVGVWDTVKFVGWFNLLGRFRQAKWPFTRNMSGVSHVRHAVSIDEKRRYYAEYLIDNPTVDEPDRTRKEVWFAGVHSDVGGGFPQRDLSRIALKWVVEEAVDLGMMVRPRKYAEHVGVRQGEPLSEDLAHGPSHPAGWVWAILGVGWRKRKLPEGALVHHTVQTRLANPSNGYRIRLPEVEFVDR